MGFVTYLEGLQANIFGVYMIFKNQERLSQYLAAFKLLPLAVLVLFTAAAEAQKLNSDSC